MEITQLPQGFEFKILSNYNIADYWTILDETAIFVNTSYYESFCCALFEARAKGVATIQRKGLNSNQHLKAHKQVEYTAEAYKEEILFMTTDEAFKVYGTINRKYVIYNCTLGQMRDSYKKVYDLI